MKLVTADLANGPRIEPSSVLAYLRAGAWEEVDEHRLDGRHVITLFEHQRRPHIEVHVPVWQEARDYSRVLAEAINTIATAEQRSTLALLFDLRAARSDVLRVHMGDGPLTLPRTMAVLSAIRSLYAAAASAIGYDFTAVGGSLPRRTDALFERITLELGDPGDSVVRVLVPIGADPAFSAELVSAAAEWNPPSLERRVTEAVAVMVTAIGRTENVGALEPLVAAGVDGAVCRALALVGAPFTLELAWALARPREPVEPVTLSDAQLAVLAQAAERLPSTPRRG